MNVQTKTTIQINGETYTELTRLEITQQINNHHSFRIILGSEKINEASNAFLEKARDFAGSDVTVEIINSLQESFAFKGVVINTRSSGNSNSELGHNIILEGYSPTILLDSGAHSNAYVDKSLQEIVDEICKEAPQNLISASVNPVATQVIPYTVQYNESWFAFLNRLACRHGEWFYFDGEALVFGKKKQQTIELFYGTDLLSFDLGLSLTALGQSFSARNYRDNELVTDSINAYSSSMKGHTAFAMDKSKKTFRNAPAIKINLFDDETGLTGQISKLAELAYKAEATRRVTFNGKSINPAIKPGAIVTINYSSLSGKSQHGEYVVTGVQHNWQVGGQYQNAFTAIPSDVEVSPNTNPGLVPHCSAQTAIVADNNDPDGLGRIKVKYSWQPKGESPWMRISVPYGGTNKGMYFVPELDEEVMVGFEDDNAEKPFVMGALYHGSAKPDDWATETNDKKCIRTRSGHTIEFDDKYGNESIVIKDSKGNMIQLDTVSGSLQISAPENISISGKNIDISASENISIGARDNLSVYAGEDYTLAAKNMTAQAEENSQVLAKNIEYNAEKVRIDSTKDPLELASGKTVDLQSGEKVRLF